MTSLPISPAHQRNRRDSSSSSSDTGCQSADGTLPISNGAKGHEPPSRRISWRFNTDWEGAAASFRRRSSVLTSSLNSWYHVLDIGEDTDEVDQQHIDDGKSCKGEVKEKGIKKRPTIVKEKSFKRSVHNTLLSDEERSSFQSSLGGDRINSDMNSSCDSLNLSDPVVSRNTMNGEN
eukprot:CCRYP_006124-RA/>CCRYP_006124-RA protein AED:0.27 eAED:0.27 QI:0/-1/0/1/-1/1/1/0/176